jgi:hypothetical protein
MIKGKYDESTKINLILFLLTAVSVAASFYPNWHLWGLDSVRIFPIWLRFSLIAILAGLAIPNCGKIVNEAAFRFFNSQNSNRLNIIFAIIGATLVVLFIILSSRNYFLGDGFTIEGNIRGGMYFFAIEPLEYSLHYALYKLFGSGQDAVYWAYALCSYFCGVLFLVGLFIFIKDKTRLILSLAIISCFVAIQFFFGYVESYTFRFVFMFFYSLCAINDFNNDRISFVTLLFLFLAIIFHLSSAVLVPSAIYLAVRKFPRRRQYIILATSTVGGLAAGIAYLSLFNTVPLDKIMVPLWSNPNNPYTLFSGWHLSDVVNIILLNYPLLLIAVFITKFRKELFSPFYLLLLGPGILFFVLIDPKLGAYRDWDLMSIAAGPLMAFLIASPLFKERKENGIYAAFIALAIFGILHTGSWIIQNASKDRSYAYAKEAVKKDIHYSRYYSKGHMNKSWAMLVNRYQADREEMLRAMYERYYGDPSDFINTCQLAEALGVLGHYDQAVEITAQNWEKFKGEPYSATKLSTTMINMGRLSEAEQICQGFLSTGKQDTLVYYNLANIKQLQGQTDSFYYYLDKSYSINFNKTPKIMFSFYLNCFIQGYDKIAAAGINRIMPRLSGSDRSFAAGMLTVLSTGSTANIDSLRTGLSKSMKTPPFP